MAIYPLRGAKLGEDLPLARRIDEVDASTQYVGLAPIGTTDSEDKWQIKRILKTGTVTAIEYADGDDKFDNVWDNRLSLSYS